MRPKEFIEFKKAFQGDSAPHGQINTEYSEADPDKDYPFVTISTYEIDNTLNKLAQIKVLEGYVEGSWEDNYNPLVLRQVGFSSVYQGVGGTMHFLTFEDKRSRQQ